MPIDRWMDKGDVAYIYMCIHIHTHTYIYWCAAVHEVTKSQPCLSNWTTNIFYSAIKKNEIMLFAATWMDIRDYHTKWNKSDRYHMTSLTCEIWKKNYKFMIIEGHGKDKLGV